MCQCTSSLHLLRPSLTINTPAALGTLRMHTLAAKYHLPLKGPRLLPGLGLGRGGATKSLEDLVGPGSKEMLPT